MSARPGPGAAQPLSAWIAALQCLLALSWTMYVLFLPPLLDRAGIPRAWLVWILILDQAVFALSDWAAGVHADRLARAMRRLGRPLAVAAVASSVAMAALPWIASLGSPTAMLVAILVWASLSSALRAPAFSLLARVGGVSLRSGAVSLALVGVSVGGALGPLLTTTLRGVDPRLPLALAALALALAAVAVSRIEPRPHTATADPVDRRGLLALLGAAFAAALGMQLHTTLLGDPVYRGAQALGADLLRPAFWIGFALGLPLAARAARSGAALRWAAWAMAAGAVALAAPRLIGLDLVTLAAQPVAGAAWAIAFSTALWTVIERGGPTGAGTPLGLLFSVLAVAALTRLVLGAAGAQGSPLVSWLPIGVWVVAALVLGSRAFSGLRPACPSPGDAKSAR